MQRRSMDQIARRVQSRKDARALSRVGKITAREMRAAWTKADKQYGGGRYRWHQKWLRAELMRLRMNEATWPQPLCV